MSEVTPAATVEQVATPAQEPSNPVTEVKDTEAPQEGEVAKPELSDAEKAQKAFEKRIARQTAANREQQRQLQAAQDKIREYEEKLKAVQPRDDQPKLEDFDTPEEFAEALAEHKIAQREKAKADEAQKPDVEKLAEQKAQLKIKEIEFTRKEEDFRKVEPNYDKNAAVVNQFLGLANKSDPRFAAFSTVLMNTENAPALVNYLGANPQEIMALFNAGSPFEVQDTLEVMIEKLGVPAVSQDEQQKAPEVNLPPPPSPLKGSTRVAKRVEDMSGKELLAKYYQKGK